MTNRNYGVVPLVVLLIPVLAISIPIFLFGLGSVILFFKAMFSPVTSGAIPIWAIFAAGIVVLMILKRRRTNPYVV